MACGWGVGLIAVPGTAYYQFTLRRALAGMPRTDHRRTFSDQLRATADAMPSFAIYVALAAIFFVTAVDVFFIYESVSDRDMGGVLLFAIFTLLLLLTGRLLYLKRLASEPERQSTELATCGKKPKNPASQ